MKVSVLIPAIAFVWLTLLSSMICLGQITPQLVENYSIDVSDPYPVIDGEKYYFGDGDKLFALKKYKDGIAFQKFNTTGGVEHVETIEYQDLPDSYTIEDVRIMDGKGFLFYSVYEKKEKIETLNVRQFDLDALKFLDGGKVLLAIEGKLTGSPWVTNSIYVGYFKVGSISMGVVAKFDFHKSSDGSKLLVQYKKKPESRKDAKTYNMVGMAAFDNDLNKLWQHEVEMPYTAKKMDLLDFTVDSESNGYMLALVFNDDSRKKFVRDQLNYRVEMLKIEGATGQVSTFPIDLKGKAINSIMLFEHNSDQMTCTGFYNLSKKTEHADGVFVFKLGKDGTLKDERNYEIPVEVINQYESERNVRRNEPKDEEDDGSNAEMKNLVMRDVFFNSNGDMVLTAEHYKHTEYRSRRGVRHVYEFHDIFACKINASGELAWMQKLGKRQMGGNSGQGAMSFRHILAGDEHYFFFVDHYENVQLSTDQVPARYTDNGMGIGRLSAYRINDGNGRVSKLNILDTRDVKLNPMDEKGSAIKQFEPAKIIDISDNVFVFEVYKGQKEDVLIKVTLEDDELK